MTRTGRTKAKTFQIRKKQKQINLTNVNEADTALLISGDEIRCGFTSFASFSIKADVAGIVLVNRQSALAISLGLQIANLLEGQPAYPVQR
jgi:hypothetical protein